MGHNKELFLPTTITHEVLNGSDFATFINSLTKLGKGNLSTDPSDTCRQSLLEIVGDTVNSPARKNQRMRCKTKPTASNRQSSANPGVHEIKAKETELLDSRADEDFKL